MQRLLHHGTMSGVSSLAVWSSRLLSDVSLEPSGVGGAIAKPDAASKQRLVDSSCSASSVPSATSEGVGSAQPRDIVERPDVPSRDVACLVLEEQLHEVRFVAGGDEGFVVKTF